jgi:hypothetical protein
MGRAMGVLGFQGRHSQFDFIRRVTGWISDGYDPFETP